MHIHNMENWQVNFLIIQQLNLGEWAVHPEMTTEICLWWGMSDVDLLVYRFNNKLEKFVSWNRGSLNVCGRCPGDSLESVFSLICAFLPPLLFSWLLHRVKVECPFVCTVKGGGHCRDSDYTGLTKKNVLCYHPKSLGRQAIGCSRLARFAMTGSNLTFCFTVTGFYGMSVEAVFVLGKLFLAWLQACKFHPWQFVMGCILAFLQFRDVSGFMYHQGTDIGLGHSFSEVYYISFIS